MARIEQKEEPRQTLPYILMYGKFLKGFGAVPADRGGKAACAPLSCRGEGFTYMRLGRFLARSYHTARRRLHGSGFTELIGPLGPVQVALMSPWT